MSWFYDHILSNPSKQDQWGDHFYPTAFWTFLCLSVPVWGVWIALFQPARSLYKELVTDEHWKNLFSKGYEGQDGRVDLFFRLLGCAVPYAVFFLARLVR